MRSPSFYLPESMLKGREKTESAMPDDLSYKPLVLRSLTEITAYFKVGRQTVYQWIDMGAPIAQEESRGHVRYSCEAAALQKWRLEKCQEKTGSHQR